MNITFASFLFFLTLMVLKLTHVIFVSWAIVTLPMWGWFLIAAVIMAAKERAERDRRRKIHEFMTMRKGPK